MIQNYIDGPGRIPSITTGVLKKPLLPNTKKKRIKKKTHGNTLKIKEQNTGP